MTVPPAQHRNGPGASESRAVDDAWVQWLCALDERLAGAGDCQEQCSQSEAEDSAANEMDGQRQFTRPEDFLRLVEQVWPRRPRGVEAALDSCLDSAGDDPRVIGRFRILGELGRGGFGVVLLAEDPIIGRQVALKVPRPEMLLTSQLRERFLREARAQSLLNHPHIVPVYEAGQIGAVCYVASAYSAGTNLQEWMRTRSAAIPPRQAAAIVRQLAAALAHAHERGVWHRDIKPSNVLVEHGESDGGADGGVVVRLIDFGLAKLCDSAEKLTRSHCQLGTPHYMAPEQAEGDSGRIGVATDVYGLGVLLYECLCGQTPFVGHSDVQVLRQIVEDDPPRLRRLRREIPRDLEAICLKCLEKDPQCRYATAAELGEDLKRFLDRRPIRARRVSAAERLGRWARRRPVVAALVAALLCVGVASTFLIYREWRRTQRALAATEHERHRLEGRLRQTQDFASLVAHIVHSQEGGADLDAIDAEISDAILGLFRSFVEHRDPRRITFEESRAFGHLASLLRARGELTEAGQMAALAVAARHELSQTGDPRVVPAQVIHLKMRLARILLASGQPRRALSQIEEIRSLIAASQFAIAPEEHLCYRFQADCSELQCYVSMKDVDQVVALVYRMHGIRGAHFENPEYELACSRIMLRACMSAANLLTPAGRYAEAEECLVEGQKCWQHVRALGGDSRAVLSDGARLSRESAKLNRLLGRHYAAIADLRESLCVPRRPNTEHSLGYDCRDWDSLIESYVAVKDVDAARLARVQAIEETERRLPRLDHPHADLVALAQIYFYLIEWEDFFGRDKRSQVWCRQAIEQFEFASQRRLLTAEERLEEVKLWYYYGRKLAERTSGTTAYDRLIRCETRAASLVAESPTNLEARGYLARSRSWLGRICRDRGCAGDAKRWFWQAAEEYRRILRVAPHENGFAADLRACDEYLASIANHVAP